MKRRTQKNERRKTILELLQLETISSQKILQNRLTEKGIAVNQATLSRDLRDMGVLKVPMGTGGARYIVNPEARRAPVRHEAVLRNVISRLDLSGNVAVIHTAPGNAQAAGIALDNLAIPGILGTVAGDDTVIVILAEGAGQNEFENELRRRIGWTEQ